MAKTKVKLKLDPRLSKSNLFGKRFQQSVGSQVVWAMREAIAMGLSPVRGVGRFVAYSAQRHGKQTQSFFEGGVREKYARLSSKLKGRKGVKNLRALVAQKKKEDLANAKSTAQRVINTFYPNSVKKDFPSKQARPVNLELDGSFLDTLGYDAKDGAVEIGHIDPSQQTKNLFEAHNEGLNTKAQVPQRKYLPNKRGDEFIVSIMRLIKSLYQERIRQIIGKK